MCRLLGFRSVTQSRVHRSLLSAENALAVQSSGHPDGWGVAYYISDSPHVIRNVGRALEDQIFQHVSGVVTSETVLAHVRKANVGPVNILNAHPFQHGKWVFAHNGQVHGFAAVRDELVARIAPALRRYILGDTDSEVLFYLFLTHLATLTDVHRRGTAAEDVAASLVEVATTVGELTDGGDAERSKLTFVATDGHTMAGLRWGPTLYFSTHKARCLDRDECPYLSPECEAPTATGFVNHLLVSSEPLQGDNVWTEMADGEIVGVDWKMRLFRERFAAPHFVGELCEAAAGQPEISESTDRPS
jgi:glutamine amidotransferase